VGTIAAIDGVEEARKIEGVREISFTKQIGDTVGTVGSSTDRVGFVIAQAETAEEAVAICEKVCGDIRITVK
jgi:hypothetical protein